MRQLINKIRQASTWAGAAVALTSINWASVAPMGSQSWWVSVAAVVGGIMAVMLNDKEGE